jgi:hypothetical protein
MDALKAVLRFLVKIDFRSHEQLLPKDYPVLIGQLEGGAIGMFVVGERLMAALQQIAVLMFDFPHNFLTSYRITMAPQVFMRSVSLSWLVKPFL